MIVLEQKLEMSFFMNLIDKLPKPKPFVQGFLMASTVFVVVLFVIQIHVKNTDTDNLNPTVPLSLLETPPTIGRSNERQINFAFPKNASFEELSPDGLKKVAAYNQEFDPIFFENYSSIATDTTVMIAGSKDDFLDRKIVYTGDKWEGEPHWLGNDHLFFSARCGTSCSGLYLVDVRTRKTLLGTVSSMFRENGDWYTTFQDWFGKKIEFPGFVKSMHAEETEDKTYLVLETEDEDEQPLDEKRFLFTGNALVLQ